MRGPLFIAIAATAIKIYARPKESRQNFDPIERRRRSHLYGRRDISALDLTPSLMHTRAARADNELAKWLWCVRITLLACTALEKNIACASTSAEDIIYSEWWTKARALGIQYWLGPNVFIEWVHQSSSRCLLHFSIFFLSSSFNLMRSPW